MRCGVVLGKRGGYFKIIQNTVKLGFFVIFGNGKKYNSFIYLKDLSKLIEWLVVNDKKGVYNGVMPNYYTDMELVCELRKLRKFVVFKLPAFVIKALFPRMNELFLDSKNSLP
ncbi:MAG: hypothetical protein HC896_04450, partial [Bacteroidales bacterium]|nr:hypothetical protein [Bacteroidales bacterium]